MNNIRRKKISDALELIARAREILEDVQEQEQEAFDALPEGIQYSDRGDAIEHCADILADSVAGLEEIEETVYEECELDKIPLRRRTS